MANPCRGAVGERACRYGTCCPVTVSGSPTWAPTATAGVRRPREAPQAATNSRACDQPTSRTPKLIEAWGCHREPRRQPVATLEDAERPARTLHAEPAGLARRRRCGCADRDRSGRPPPRRVAVTAALLAALAAGTLVVEAGPGGPARLREAPSRVGTGPVQRSAVGPIRVPTTGCAPTINSGLVASADNGQVPMVFGA